MSKQSRLNKEKAAKAKANQDQQKTQGHQHDAQRNSQARLLAHGSVLSVE